MKMKCEREQGMTSIYRKLKKECRSFNLRRHLATFILAFAMMAPAGVYADWTGEILFEKPAGQAYADGTGWADMTGNISHLDQIQFIGHGVVTVHLCYPADQDCSGDNKLRTGTVHGAARLKVITDSIGNHQAIIEECAGNLNPSSCSSGQGIGFDTGFLTTNHKIIVELKGAFEVTHPDNTVPSSQRGRLDFVLKVLE